MKNGLDFLLLTLLTGCLPLCAQDETNAAPYGNSGAYGNPMPYGGAGAYGDAGAYSNAGPYGYGAPGAMPAQPLPTDMRPRPRPPTLVRPLRPQALPPAQPVMVVSNLELQRQILPPRSIPPMEVVAPTAMRISNAPMPAHRTPIRELRAPSPLGVVWTVGVCTNAADLANGCLETGLRMAAINLDRLYYQEYHQGQHPGELKVILPASLTQAQQTSFLYRVEFAAIQTTQRQLATADGKFALRAGDTPQLRQEKQTSQVALNGAVQAWADKALAEAGAGSNWDHDWPANTHTFVFRGAAFEQFKAICQALREEPAPGTGGN